MRVLELFSGTSSVGRAFAMRGHEVATVDWDESFRPTACADIGCLGVADVRELADDEISALILFIGVGAWPSSPVVYIVSPE